MEEDEDEDEEVEEAYQTNRGRFSKIFANFFVENDPETTQKRPKNAGKRCCGHWSPFFGGDKKAPPRPCRSLAPRFSHWLLSIRGRGQAYRRGVGGWVYTTASTLEKLPVYIVHTYAQPDGHDIICVTFTRRCSSCATGSTTRGCRRGTWCPGTVRSWWRTRRRCP